MLWYICLIISALIIAVTVPLFVRMRVFKRKKLSSAIKILFLGFFLA